MGGLGLYGRTSSLGPFVRHSLSKAILLKCDWFEPSKKTGPCRNKDPHLASLREVQVLAFAFPWNQEVLGFAHQDIDAVADDTDQDDTHHHDVGVLEF